MHYYCIWRRLKLLTGMKVFHRVYVCVILMVILVGSMSEQEHSTEMYEMDTVHTN